MGCRWAPVQGAERMLLFPEGAIRLQGTGRQILERCDGERTLQQIMTELQTQYGATSTLQIREEVEVFLNQLKQKRIIDF